MHGNLFARRDATFRTYWDLWYPAVTLQLVLSFSDDGGRLEESDVFALLSWMEGGARPQDPWVQNHLMYGIGREVRGEATRRLLRLFDERVDKHAHWWVLSPLEDPEALPQLRAWAELPAANPQQHDELRHLIERLEHTAAPEDEAW
jgi:hypothetical protein